MRQMVAGRWGLVASTGWLTASLLLLATPGFGQWGNAQRGAALVRDETCATCHRAPAASRDRAPDLTRPALPDVTPGALISTLWNHGPILWRAPGKTRDTSAK